MTQWLQKFSFLLFTLSVVNAYSIGSVKSINPIREKFFEASYDKTSFLELSEMIEQFGASSSLELEAYFIASQVLSAKYTANPYEKVRLVYRGLNKMNLLVLDNSENLELRFLRFALEYHVPSILMVHKHIDDDQSFIIENVFKVKELELSEKFGNTLLGFMEETGYFSELQESILRENLFK